MVGIIDYGVGNLFSLKSSFEMIGENVIVSSGTKIIEECERIILPGVGAFGDAAKKLKECGMHDLVLSEAKKGKPILGICLGMQLLFEKSYEYGIHEGLGLIEGEIRPISNVCPKSFKIPHIGWNRLDFCGKSSPIFKNINDGDFVYFVHSYYAANCTDSVIATSEYGADLTAAVAKDNVFGCQFHPEKSGKTGLAILKAFCEIEV